MRLLIDENLDPGSLQHTDTMPRMMPATGHACSRKGLAYVSCDLCGSDTYESLFEKSGFRYVKCRICGLVYVNPRLGNPSLRQETFYDTLSDLNGGIDKLAHGDYSGSRKRRHIREAAAYLPYNVNGRILDIGCGFGGFLKGAAEAGWTNPEGLEIAPQPARYVSQFFPVETKPVEETSYEYSFDVIRIHNVLEHVPSPSSLIASAYRHLRPGGLLVISTPNFRSLSVTFCREKWHYIGGEDHIHLFTPKTIAHLLDKKGFHVTSITTRGVHLIPKIYGKKPFSYREILLRNEVLFLKKLFDLFVRYTLRGNRIRVCAEKRSCLS